MEVLASERTVLQDVCYTEVPERKQLTKIARLYANAFAGAPWYEYQVCGNGHYSGLQDKNLKKCRTCDEPLKLAYPEDETVTYIAGELGKPNATLITVVDKSNDVFGAVWGFKCSVEQLKNKYKSPEMQEKVGAAIKKTASKVDDVFYFSEAMVAKEVQGQGIATRLSKSLSGKADELGLKMVMRTINQSPMVKIANKLKMSQIIKLGEDTDNKERMLYISK